MLIDEQFNKEEFLTRKQLAETLKVSVVTIQRWGQEGCPTFEIGKASSPKGARPRYRLSGVLAWLGERSKQRTSVKKQS